MIRAGSDLMAIVDYVDDTIVSKDLSQSRGFVSWPICPNPQQVTNAVTRRNMAFGELTVTRPQSRNCESFIRFNEHIGGLATTESGCTRFTLPIQTVI